MSEHNNSIVTPLEVYMTQVGKLQYCIIRMLCFRMVHVKSRQLIFTKIGEISTRHLYDS